MGAWFRRDGYAGYQAFDGFLVGRLIQDSQAAYGAVIPCAGNVWFPPSQKLWPAEMPP